MDGERIPLRQVRPAIANEPDRARRERLERARCEVLDEQLNPVHVEAFAATHAAVPALGGEGYVELYRRFAVPLDETAEQCRAFLESTQKLYEEAADRLFRSRLGVGLDDARAWDVARLYRAPQWDPQFPKEQMLPALEATLAGLGIDLRRQENIHLDVEERPLKSPRAFCSPIEVPQRVMLVIKPMGGPDDWHALFHEAGHAEHFAHTSSSLPMESRRLGDNSVTEGWAMLLEYLVDDPAWHAQRLEHAAGGRVRLRGRDHAALHRAPLLREAPVRARAARARTTWPRRAPATRAARRRRAHRADVRELPRGRRFRVLRHVLPARVGRRSAAAGIPARALRHGLVHAARGRVAPARAVGGRARDGRPTSCSARWPTRASNSRRSPTAHAPQSVLPSCI